MVLIKNYIESFSYEEKLSRDEKIKRGRTHFFDFDYPFYDESKREEFEVRLIKHFYMRESVETIGLTKFRLEDYLVLNMPYWNKMFESELLDFPVFEDFDYTVSETENNTKDSKTDTDVVKNKNKKTETDITKNETSNEEQTVGEQTNSEKTTSDTTNEDNFHRNVFDDTPQNDLQISTNGNGTGVINRATTLEEDKNINNMTATGSEKNDVDKTQNVNKDTTGNETRNIDGTVIEDETQGLNTDVLETKTKSNDKTFKGKKGVTDYADLMRKYRATFIRIEKMIFNEINKEGIFLLVYGGR